MLGKRDLDHEQNNFHRENNKFDLLKNNNYSHNNLVFQMIKSTRHMDIPSFFI